MTTTIQSTNNAALAAASEHHAQLRAGLVERTEALIDAVAAQHGVCDSQSRLVDYLRAELLPHVEVEENLLYTGTATPQIRLLVRAMSDEHRMIGALIDELSRTHSGMQAACLASALVVLFDVRIEQEDRLLLPALAVYGLDLATVLSDHPEIIGRPEGCDPRG